MPTVIHQRDKCIGCNYCVEIAPENWRMNKRDGKCTLIGATEKRGFWSVKIFNNHLNANLKAAEVCPVKIIQVRQ